MPEVELAGPMLRTDAQWPSRFQPPTENPRGRAHGSRSRPNGLDEQGLKGIYWLAVLCGKPLRPTTEETLHGENCIALRLAGSSSRAAQWLRLENSECEVGLRS